MSQPIVVSLPHSLGQAEAMRRITAAMEKARADLGNVFSQATVEWRGNHADLKVVAMMQTVTAGVDVFEDSARIELQLPWFLAPVQKKIVEVLTKRSGDALKSIGYTKT